MATRLASLRLPICRLRSFPAVPVPVRVRAPAPLNLRAMSSAAPSRKYEWLVVVPDFPGVLQKRLDVRP